MLLLPVWSVTLAWYPIAMVLVPVLFWRAPTPTAVLLLPMMLAESACVPVALLLLTVVSDWSARMKAFGDRAGCCYVSHLRINRSSDFAPPPPTSNASAIPIRAQLNSKPCPLPG